MSRTLAALLALALVGLPTAAAHASKTTEDGAIRITWGLLSEPGYTHEKNRLDLIIRDNATGAGIGGLTPDDITVKLRYGAEEYDLGEISAYRGAKGASAGEGNYTSANPVYLTREGLYTLHIAGTIRGSEVDMEIPAAHEYHNMKDIMFPDEIELGAGGAGGSSDATIAALEQRIAALEAKAAAQSTTPVTTQTQSNPVPGFTALAALAAVGLVLALRRRA